MQELTGQRLGKYLVEAPLARGGMAVVYRGRDTALDRPVAIKVLDPALAGDPGAAERFRREAITAANLEHPNIMPVYDVGEVDGLYYMAMRYVPGETLRELLQREGRLSPERALQILRPVALALDYAHEHGVIHRDVKPGNIIIEPSGHVVLTDFGIARAASQQHLTGTGKVMGTAEYLAPEQIQGQEVTASADIYALGILLYEMLTGRTPFEGQYLAETLYKQVHEAAPPLRVVAPQLPLALQPVLDQALEKTPALRFHSGADLVRAFEPFASGYPQAGRIAMASAPTAAMNVPPAMPPQGAGGGRPAPVPAPLAAPAQGLDRRLLLAGAAALIVVAIIAALLLRARAANGGLATPGPGLSSTVTAGSTVVTSPQPPDETAVAALRTPQPPTATAAPPQPTPAKAAFAAPRIPAYSGPRRQGNAPDLYMGRALQPPTIDGDIGDWTGASPFTPVKVVANPGSWKGPQDLSAEFRIGYDDSNFYVSVVVTDDVHVQNDKTRRYDLWKGDDVELWFDFDLAGDFNKDPGNADDWQIGLSPGEASVAQWPPQAVFFMPAQHPGSEMGVVVAAKPQGQGGYVLEARVPWPMPGWKPQADGGAIGFCASVGDNDVPGSAQQQKLSSTCSRMQWNVPTTFGMLYY